MSGNLCSELKTVGLREAADGFLFEKRLKAIIFNAVAKGEQYESFIY